MKIKDLSGEEVLICDLDGAIEQCRDCMDSPYVMDEGFTVGQNYAFMLKQLLTIREQQKEAGKQ